MNRRLLPSGFVSLVQGSFFSKVQNLSKYWAGKTIAAVSEAFRENPHFETSRSIPCREGGEGKPVALSYFCFNFAKIRLASSRLSFDPMSYQIPGTVQV